VAISILDVNGSVRFSDRIEKGRIALDADGVRFDIASLSIPDE
jgi:hypothetical protein